MGIFFCVKGVKFLQTTKRKVIFGMEHKSGLYSSIVDNFLAERPHQCIEYNFIKDGIKNNPANSPQTIHRFQVILFYEAGNQETQPTQETQSINNLIHHLSFYYKRSDLETVGYSFIMDMMDSQSFCIDLIAKNHPTYPMVKAKCGAKSYVVKLPPHRIFSAVQEVIFVESDLNRQCLRLLQEGKLEVAPNKFQQVQEYCVGTFGIEAEVDVASLVMKLFFGQEEDTAEHLTILDKVTFIECVSFFNLAYEKLSSRLNNKINRKLRRYISIAKRSASEKSMLQKLYKQCKDIPEQKNEQVVQEKVNVKGRSTGVAFEKSDKPYVGKKKEEGSIQEGKNRKYVQRQKNKKSNDKFYQQKRPVSREKTFDERILLGIKGDSEEGWRQRIRPSRIPPKTQIKTQAFTHKKPEVVIHRQQKKEEQPSNSALVKVFEFPLNGNKFDFHCLAKGKKHFMLHINGTFWVKFIDDILTISNHSKGYIRKGSQLDIMENGSGFMAEGLTIKLDGLSNMEDGGDGFGDPTVEEIINSNNQWFSIVTMDIYIKQ